ncbi:DMT family transporter [Pseudaestuariivita atlantica]|uniref:Peptide ABC transporter permease n=1 Tax=Pseudaestuariivita atlantica TaxID=1317121 RepID=A0A0L1JS14_9RHOB|nr:DMT family transporter [Pseudaestuariivita atlantica]KNG94540.1 peptide ABC transporter permease [Pseudaestuariivita atlantica]
MDIRALFMGLVFALMWSSAFTSARVIVAYAPPVGTLSVRFLLSGLLALILARALGQSFRLNHPQWRATLIFGICQNAIYLGLNFYAMQTVEASLASIIASTMPLMVAVAGFAVFGERLAPLAALGLVAGFGGVALIMGGRVGGALDVQGVTLCFIAAAALTVATLAMRGASSGGNILTVVGYQMLIGAAVLAVVSLATETYAVTWSWQLLAAFTYTTLFPGLAATWVWFVLVQRIGAVKAATFHFLNPFFGVLVAWALLGEALGLLDILGVTVIAAGILAVQLSKVRPVRSSSL